MPQRLPVSRRRSRGLFLVLVLFFIVVVLALAALAIGGGMLLAASARAQNVVNAAANAGIDALAKSSGESIEEWTEDTVTRINQILEENSAIPGMSRRLGPIAAAPNENGQIELGLFFPELPATGEVAECNSQYPCFVPVSSGTIRPSAVRLTLNSAPDNLLWMPFASILGSSFGDVKAVAISRVIPSCTVFLSDMSLSMAKQTHNSDKPAFFCTPPDAVTGLCDCGTAGQRSGDDCSVNHPTLVSPIPYWRIPPDAWGVPEFSRFAFRADYVLGPTCSLGEWLNTYDDFDLPPPANCNVVRANGCKDCRCLPHYTIVKHGTPDAIGERDETRAWCNLRSSRPNNMNTRTPGEHYQDDYYEMTVTLYREITDFTPYETRFLVDKYFLSEAEPLRTALLAINAGLRVRDVFKTETDLAIMLGFTREVVAWLYQNPSWSSGAPLWLFDTDTERLLSASNYNYMGLHRANRSEHPRYPPVPYNFLVKGFFPRSKAPASSFDTPSGSHLLGAVIAAAKALADPDHCPLEATKNIVLFSDGLANCVQEYSISGGGDIIIAGSPACLNEDGGAISGVTEAYAKFQWVKNDLLNVDDHITQFLIDNKISLTSVLVDMEADTAVQVVDTGDHWYYTAQQLLQQGRTDTFFTTPTIPAAMSSEFDEWQDACNLTYGGGGGPFPLCNESHFAYSKHGSNGVVFREPADLWATIAHRTNGAVCPIRRLCFDMPDAPCSAISEEDGGVPCYEDHDDEPATPKRLRDIYFTDENLSYEDGGRHYLRCSDIEQSPTEQAVACVMNALGFAPYQSVAVE